MVTWDEIFTAIGTSMFGYIIRRVDGGYPFEINISELVRTKIFEKVGQRSINLFPHEMDHMLIQFKQLGYIIMNEKKTGEEFTLTPLGKHQLTRASSVLSHNELS
jgi:hypothetical protein